MLYFFTAQLSTTAWNDTIWMGWSLGWALSPQSSLVREGEKVHGWGHAPKPAWKQLWRLAKEIFGQVDILHGGRLNTVPPPHCLLCNSNRGRKVFPQQGGAWPGAGRGSKKSESRLPGERPWQQEDQKKQEQTLGQIVWSSGAGDNCILKISWGMGLE